MNGVSPLYRSLRIPFLFFSQMALDTKDDSTFLLGRPSHLTFAFCLFSSTESNSDSDITSIQPQPSITSNDYLSSETLPIGAHRQYSFVRCRINSGN
ncbi:hypothetical protein AB6A40_001201 [Gnathostoma spinigerum]|uniref:Uncharacterized protein n=1 Tax=Gnathostoma spinigerum TaxID=75299 RepID=A0ABD6ECS0_9BILA